MVYTGHRGELSYVNESGLSRKVFSCSDVAWLPAMVSDPEHGRRTNHWRPPSLPRNIHHISHRRRTFECSPTKRFSADARRAIGASPRKICTAHFIILVSCFCVSAPEICGDVRLRTEVKSIDSTYLSSCITNLVQANRIIPPACVYLPAAPQAFALGRREFRHLFAVPNLFGTSIPYSGTCLFLFV